MGKENSRMGVARGGGTTRRLGHPKRRWEHEIMQYSGAWPGQGLVRRMPKDGPGLINNNNNKFN